ncbi:Phenylalanine--tRNA ligase alpha subunit [Gossypium arboreum]|uniref:Phenylalanine--tRNA ligase alpha subunit n=1 Tax=Gossypium arboreum TaxID=29729 RepID=A0A0B0PJY4_GOSAR|nr:Phenylalanine--tRNA ligase alpha subunit [Gossypium arboreum]
MSVFSSHLVPQRVYWSCLSVPAHILVKTPLQVPNRRKHKESCLSIPATTSDCFHQLQNLCGTKLSTYAEVWSLVPGSMEVA